MIDIHSHILNGVDDGAASLDESIAMLKEAAACGIDTIIATPHCKDIAKFNKELILEKYNELVPKALEYGIKLKLGCEIKISPDIREIIAAEKVFKLNNTNYILLEFPFETFPIYSREVIYQLQLEGITPIIAHPERNSFFVRHFETLQHFIERDCLLQVDAGSLTGSFGRQTKRFAKRLIKEGLVHFVASDAHTADQYKRWVKKSQIKARKWAGEDRLMDMYAGNAGNLLEL